jgi:hypothetical protein
MSAAVTHGLTCGIAVQPAGRGVVSALSVLEPQFNSLHFTVALLFNLQVVVF